jgi:hypothetical protein
VSWRRESGGRLRLDVDLPPGVSANVWLPARRPGRITESGRPSRRSVSRTDGRFAKWRPAAMVSLPPGRNVGTHEHAGVRRSGRWIRSRAKPAPVCGTVVDVPCRLATRRAGRSRSPATTSSTRGEDTAVPLWIADTATGRKSEVVAPVDGSWYVSHLAWSPTDAGWPTTAPYGRIAKDPPQMSWAPG